MKTLQEKDEQIDVQTMDMPNHFISTSQSLVCDEVVSKLLRHRVALLFAGMRSGKTRMSLYSALKFFSHHFLTGTVRSVNILVVTTPAVKSKNTFAKEVDVLKDSFPLINVNLFVFTFGTLHQISDADFRRFNFVIVDESHKLKKFPKLCTAGEILRKLFFSSGLNPPCILMTGTPHSEMTFSHVVNPLMAVGYPLLGCNSFYEFAKHFVNLKISHFGPIVKRDYSEVTSQGVDAIKALAVYSSSEDHNVLTNVVHNFIHCDLSVEQISILNSLPKDGSSSSVLHFDKHDVYRLIDRATKFMSTVHQISSGSLLYSDTLEPNTSIPRVVRFFDENKTSRIVELLLLHSSLVVMTVYQGEVDLIFQNPLIFKASTEGRLLVGHFTTLSTGIDLSHFDALVFFNLPFSCTSYEQACARLSSRSKSTAIIYYLFSSSGFEEKIYNKLISKQSFSIQHFRSYLRESNSKKN